MNPELLQKTRVFWHELGHFVAQQYNQQYFGGLGTHHVIIRRQQQENQKIDFYGETVPIQPDGYQSTDTIKQPATMIASLVYGCFFQCRRYMLQWPACFGPRHTRVHGMDDYESVNRALTQCLPTPESRNLVTACIEEFFNQFQKLSEFDTLFKEDISAFISSEEDEITIQVDSLQSRFSKFMKTHEAFYVAFVTALQNIFRQYT
jgi:hypothetical protein